MFCLDDVQHEGYITSFRDISAILQAPSSNPLNIGLLIISDQIDIFSVYIQGSPCLPITCSVTVQSCEHVIPTPSPQSSGYRTIHMIM